MNEEPKQSPDPIAKLLKIIDEVQEAMKIRFLVVHRRPDTDAWLCLWLACKFIPKAQGAQIVFVNAGTALPGSENDPAALHFDTGGGEFDQHGKDFPRSSSAQLMAARLGLLEDPVVRAGISPLIELATKVDNAEPINPTSIHFLAEGYSHHFRHLPFDEKMSLIKERMFEHFDILYNQNSHAQELRREAPKHTSWQTLFNGIKIAIIFGHPEYRNAAFEEGADVVLWTQRRGNKGIDVGIQTGRESPVTLENVAAALRRNEAEARKLHLGFNEILNYPGLDPAKVPGWFLHESNRFAACGTRTHHLPAEDRTRLSPQEIQQVLCAALENLSAQA